MRNSTGSPRLTRRQLVAALPLLGIAPAAARSVPLRLVGPPNPIASLDPALARDSATIQLVQHLSRGITRVDADGSAVPELAIAITPDADGRIWQVTLRDDATFADGRPIESADVAWSWTRALSPIAAPGGMGPSFFGDIVGAAELVAGRAGSLAGVTVESPRQLTISLEEPSFSLPLRLATAQAAVVDRRQATDAPDWWMVMNSSGPYRIDGGDPTRELVLAGRDTYLGRHPGFRDVNIRTYLAARNSENLFQAGQVDFVDGIAPQLAGMLTDPALATPDSVVDALPGLGLTYIALGTATPPLDDLHVRRALQALFDASAYVGAVYGEMADVPASILPPSIMDQGEVTIPEPSVERARQELAQSRYGAADDVPLIRIFGADIGPAETLRDLAQAELGLVIEAVRVDWGDFLTGLAERTWPALTLTWNLDYPAPEAMLAVLWHSRSADNATAYANAAYDQLVAAARQAPDPAARSALWAQAQQLLIDDAVVIPVAQPRRFLLRRQHRVVPVSPMGLLGLEFVL